MEHTCGSCGYRFKLPTTPWICPNCDDDVFPQNEQEMYKMLVGAVKDYSRLCQHDDKDKMAKHLAVHFALYGGDTTCRLMCHYGENLTSKIRELL